MSQSRFARCDAQCVARDREREAQEECSSQIGSSEIAGEFGRGVGANDSRSDGIAGGIVKREGERPQRARIVETRNAEFHHTARAHRLHPGNRRSSALKLDRLPVCNAVDLDRKSQWAGAGSGLEGERRLAVAGVDLECYNPPAGGEGDARICGTGEGGYSRTGDLGGGVVADNQGPLLRAGGLLQVDGNGGLGQGGVDTRAGQGISPVAEDERSLAYAGIPRSEGEGKIPAL